jgi:hypothetical protein
MKAEHYLRKILHELYPANFPVNFTSIGGENARAVVQKVEAAVQADNYDLNLKGKKMVVEPILLNLTNVLGLPRGSLDNMSYLNWVLDGETAVYMDKISPLSLKTFINDKVPYDPQKYYRQGRGFIVEPGTILSESNLSLPEKQLLDFVQQHYPDKLEKIKILYQSYKENALQIPTIARNDPDLVAHAR